MYEGCRQTKEWQEIGLDNLVVSINVSILQLEDPEFVNKLTQILEKTNLAPEFLEIELTERILQIYKIQFQFYKKFVQLLSKYQLMI